MSEEPMVTITFRTSPKLLEALQKLERASGCAAEVWINALLAEALAARRARDYWRLKGKAEEA